MFSYCRQRSNNQPDGMAGNVDCCQMSTWFVISGLGLYAVDPVSTRYDLGNPLFDRVEVNLAGGRELVIEAKRESPKDYKESPRSGTARL